MRSMRSTDDVSCGNWGNLSIEAFVIQLLHHLLSYLLASKQSIKCYILVALSLSTNFSLWSLPPFCVWFLDFDMFRTCWWHGVTLSSWQKVDHIIIIHTIFIWGISSNGRAAALHAAGKGIDALILHFFLCQFIYAWPINDCPLDHHNSRANSRMGD
jgi:hypothetical protein